MNSSTAIPHRGNHLPDAEFAAGRTASLDGISAAC
jgi:hypothetical protein